MRSQMINQGEPAEESVRCVRELRLASRTKSRLLLVQVGIHLADLRLWDALEPASGLKINFVMNEIFGKKTIPEPSGQAMYR